MGILADDMKSPNVSLKRSTRVWDYDHLFRPDGDVGGVRPRQGKQPGQGPAMSQPMMATTLAQ